MVVVLGLVVHVGGATCFIGVLFLLGIRLPSDGGCSFHATCLRIVCNKKSSARRYRFSDVMVSARLLPTGGVSVFSGFLFH